MIHVWRGRRPSNRCMAMWFLVLPHLFLTGTWLPWRGWRSYPIALIIRIGRLRLSMVNLCQSSIPIIHRCRRSRSRALGTCCRTSKPPLRTRRCPHPSSLVVLWMYILRHRRAMLIRHSGRLAIVTKKLQSCLDMDIPWIQLSCSLVGV